MKKIAFILLIGFVLGGIIGWGILAPSLTPRETGSGTGRQRAPERGLPIGDFELTRLDGEKVRLSDFRGMPVVINFWASWCEPCKKEMPVFQAVFSERPEEFVILAVNPEEGRETAEEFAESVGLTFPILLDENKEMQKQLMVRGLPTTFFVDAEGVLRAQHVGELNRQLFTDYLAKIGVQP
ncbi:TlpA family protein disulfide reductase [Levilinea saccharolytica]|uniref:TlpA family protein disulfide reductase n=1 Tax=Levilinea saccharolytica TaxID=229921 RepID=UPI001364C5EB|nr:TlpA disulfide reductase family protein [Levilinea saccharolytica]